MKRKKEQVMTYFIGKGAVVVGDVTLGEDSSVWFNSVLRADLHPIVVGDETNVQDGTIIHVGDDHPTIIKEHVTIGHQCMIHGCTIEKGALIGMSSIILDGAVIGENSLIGAGSLVTKNTVIPPNSLAFGRPAKVIRELTLEEIAANHANTDHYVRLSKEFLANQYPEKK